MLANTNDGCEEIMRNAVAVAENRRLRDGPYAAEIVADCMPLWHVVVTEPGREVTAAANLVGRRFGVYLPYYEHSVLIHGKLRVFRQPLLPRYLLLFVWDVKRHWRRIVACAGVSQILCDRDEHPAVVPDRFVDVMQATEFGMIDIAARRKRRRKRHDPADDGQIIAISTKSFWAAMRDADGEQRKATFHRAIGLAA